MGTRKVVSELGGSMVGIDLGTGIVRVNISKLRRNFDVTSDVEMLLSPPKESMTSKGSDHASCMVTFDAALTSNANGISAPHQDCYTVTDKGHLQARLTSWNSILVP